MRKMAPSSSSSSSSSPSSSSRPSLSPPPLPSHFTPIQECDREENEDEEIEDGCKEKREVGSKHSATPPVHGSENRGGKTSGRRRRGSDGDAAVDDRGVSCNKCRPSNREKFSVVPLDNGGGGRHSSASPNGLFKSIISSLTKKSPMMSAAEPGREEQWKIAVAELSQKLMQATRKRDEALSEVSRLKYSMAELEKKLNKLEVYCSNLKSGLDDVSTNKTSPYRSNNTNITIYNQQIPVGESDDNSKKVIQPFLVSVSEARSNVRQLSRCLTLQLRQMAVKSIYDKISLLLQPYDLKFSVSKNPKALLSFLEALLTKSLFEDFESIGFQRSSTNQVLNPIERCESNFLSFQRLRGLTWEEVLRKGTKHFSEEFSGFCDRKMSEIVAMLGWNRAWPETLLQAFFGASKSVWLVHLLANSVHPSLPIFRVDRDVRFDPVYMEDMGGDKAPNLVPAVVRVMVTPGFYVHGNVVKCKVLCRYHGNGGYIEKGLTPSPI